MRNMQSRRTMSSRFPPSDVMLATSKLKRLNLSLDKAGVPGVARSVKRPGGATSPGFTSGSLPRVSDRCQWAVQVQPTLADTIGPEHVAGPYGQDGGGSVRYNPSSSSSGSSSGAMSLDLLLSGFTALGGLAGWPGAGNGGGGTSSSPSASGTTLV